MNPIRIVSAMLVSLFVGACATAPAMDNEPLAELENPSLYCRQVISAIARNQEERLLVLMSKTQVGGPADVLQQQRSYVAGYLISVSHAALEGPATQQILHKETVLNPIESHLTMEAWRNEDGASVFYGCSVTLPKETRFFIASDQPNLQKQVTDYYVDLAIRLSKSSVPYNRL